MNRSPLSFGAVRLGFLGLSVLASMAACSSDQPGSTPQPHANANPLLLVDSTLLKMPDAAPVRGRLAAAVDLNHDGAIDFVQATSDAIRVYLMDQGVLKPASDAIPKASNGPATQVVAEDFDGDGNTDLFVVGMATGKNRVLLNQGSGTFQAGGTLPAQSSTGIHAVAADLDADGDMDLIVVVPQGAPSNPPAHVDVLINDGKASFAEESSKRLPLTDYAAFGVAVGDLNGDAAPDLFFTSDQSEFRLFHNDGHGMFRDAPPDAIPQITQAQGRIPTIGDLNADGSPDLFVASAKANFVLLNDGTGRFTDQTPLVLGTQPGAGFSGTIVDLDRDGFSDLVIADPSGGLMVARNVDGRMFDYSSAVLPQPSPPSDAVVALAADLDADSDADLIVSRDNLSRPIVLINWYPGSMQDKDSDGVPDDADNCASKPNADQMNQDVNHFDCEGGGHCKQATGCDLAIWSDTTAYLACGDLKSWADAQAFCQARGADLATITSAAENDFLSKLGLDTPWFGFTDAKVEGKWVWVDASTGSYTNWSTGEPSNSGGNENCAAMAAGGKWNDAPCDQTHSFICKDSVVHAPADPGDACDVCPAAYDPDQKDTNKDGKGDACTPPK